MPSNKQSKLWSSNVGANSNDTVGIAQAIPSGDVWVITRFGAADINMGDNKSSIYTLQYGGEVLDGALIVVTGSTITLNENWEMVGDGVKKIEITRKNTSASVKQMPTWIVAYKRS